jgi:hypothetical protein
LIEKLRQQGHRFLIVAFKTRISFIFIPNRDKHNICFSNEEQEPMKKIAYCAIDYHLKHLSIAVMIKGKKQFSDVIRVPNDDRAIKKYMKTLSGEFESKACYEASSSGYAFQTKMSSWGYHCEVIAPAVIPKKRVVPAEEMTFEMLGT